MNRVRAYAQLVRVPNVFTALADICLGAAAGRILTAEPVAHGWFGRFVCLLAASACLYCGGMVWNDFFDVEQDRRERPFRPIPSGRISRRRAAGVGTSLLLAGLAFAALAGSSLVTRDGPGWHGIPLALGVALVVTILAYDGWLKRTWAGPAGMGLCRSLNVLLGLSVVSDLGGTRGLYLALVVGLYIVGVTWFARTEARTSSQAALATAAALMLVGLILALVLRAHLPGNSGSWLYPYLLVGLGFLIGIPVCRAVARPTAAAVQIAVKRAILGLVVLDAALATAIVGVAGLAILVLLLPALFLGRWIYST